MDDHLPKLFSRWKSDPRSTYNSWFLWEERLKNFRSIRRGIGQVVRDIEAGTFGNAYRGSSLETVVGSVAEQRQIFKGADHAFLWKPKLRIPDIYENADNQRAFARLLHDCDCCNSADEVLDAIRRIDALAIKGLGPAAALSAWEADLQRVREESAAARAARLRSRDGDVTHTGMQGCLRDLGRALGFEVWIATNDRGRPYCEGRLGDGCLQELPIELGSGAEAVRLIDVLWLDPANRRVSAAFEVEHSTSIYSGIVRMLDLALGAGQAGGGQLFLVAPDERRDEVAQQLPRPAFSRIEQLGIRYLPYGQLVQHGAAIQRFGAGIKPLMEISQLL